MLRAVWSIGLFAVIAAAGCSRGSQTSEAVFRPSEDDPPGSAKYFDAVKPYYLAIANGKYEEAYDQLSPYAVQDVHPDQFFDPREDVLEPRKLPRIESLTKEEFVKRMKLIEEHLGRPAEVTILNLTADRRVLAARRKAGTTMVSEKVPDNLCEAYFTGEIRCRFTPEGRRKAMQEFEMSKSEVESDENYNLQPHFIADLALISEGGTLKIAYFDFYPGMLID